MRTLYLILLAATVVWAVLAVSVRVWGAPAQKLSISPLVLHSGNRTFDPVETQNYIANDTGCPFDPDDDIKGSGYGYLDPGESATVTACLIIGPSGGFTSNALILTARGDKLPTGAQDFTITIDWYIGPYHYRFTHDDPTPTEFGPTSGRLVRTGW